MRYRPQLSRFAILATLPLAVISLAACSLEEKSAESPQSTVTETSAAEASGEASTSSTASPDPTETAFDLKGRRDVREVAQKFSSLAPPEFFDMFTTCENNGIPDSHACTGPNVGQFQFFSSEAKAASTTQLLTELRSSRVVEDSGDKIVGWSTLGTTAVITVVDNKRGLTMQQMVSSDKQDPRKRIYELGLAKPDKSSEPQPSESTTPTASPRPTTSASSN